MASLPIAVTQKGSDQLRNPFFGMFLDIEATSEPNFKSIGPSLRD